MPTPTGFTHTALGRTGARVCRLGFSASYRPGVEAVRTAFDLGITFFFGYGFDRQLTTGLAPLLRSHREKIILATGAYNYLVAHSNIRRACEKRLRQFGTEYLDVLMIRYNAAHRGAESDIFPHLHHHDPGLVSYTATRWTALLRRPRGWPEGEPVATAAQAYRFVLSNPHVDVCLTAPRSTQELRQNMDALHQGPLTEEEMSFMRRLGDAVHAQKRWFM